MSNPYSKYEALVFSRADYDQGVGFSSVMEDFPMELGAAALYDTVSGIQRFVGRDPATGLPLIVTGYDRYITQVATNGVTAASDGISPPFGVAPDVCSVTIEVTNAAILGSIDAAAKHVVYGVRNCQQDAEPDDLPAGLLPYYVGSPMPAAKRTEIINGLIARGADEAQVNAWFAARPEATPLQVRQGFAQLVQQVTERAG